MEVNYNQYKAVGMERIKYLCQGVLLIGVFVMLFYKSWFLVLLCSPLSLLFLKMQERNAMKRRKWEFNQQFQQGILAVSAALHAGYAIENAFAEALKDLSLLYEEDADIIREFQWITGQISMNRTVEDVLLELADRTKIEDVENFAEIFKTAKRTGGDIMKIIQQTGRNIGERLAVQREMETVIAQKKLEANIMSVVPLGMIAYMWLASPRFLDPLYHNLFGISVMTVILVAFLAAYALMKKITDITL